MLFSFYVITSKETAIGIVCNHPVGALTYIYTWHILRDTITSLAWSYGSPPPAKYLNRPPAMATDKNK